MDNMIKEIGLLQEYDQIQIRNDIEKRIIPQALDVLRETPCEFKKYIEQEIESAKNAKIKMIESFYLPGAIHYKISKIYVYNDERLKALNELRKSVKEEENLQSIMTENEKKYFTKAIDAGLMKEVENGYEWLHNKGMKASLGYFLHKVFNPNGTARIPYRFVESLFNESRLDRAIDQALIVKQPQKWRKEIDTLFDD